MKVLVTGGGGFLGGVVVRLLLDRGYEVVSLSRHNYPNLDEQGVQQIQGNLANLCSVEKAAEGCDVVFHTAAKVGIWGSYDSFFQTNVVGTQNILTACQKQSIGKLIYTNSPSVTFTGSDQEGVNESESYPKTYLSHYPATKAQAEKLVLQSNSPSLSTVALRPHLIWGPGDKHLVPRILEKGKTGQLRLIGNGSCLVDSTYVDNAAQAHILAADALGPKAVCAGKAYFISNDEPLPMRDLLNKILQAGEQPPVTKSISPRAAYIAGAILEAIYRIFRIEKEPRMTRFLAKQLSTAHWFDLSAAKSDFGYCPSISIDEGMRRLKKSLLTGVYTSHNPVL